LKCIRCDVCEIVATEVYEQVEAKRKEAPMEFVRARPGAPKKQKSSFSEAEVNAIVTDACNRRKVAGEWLWYNDLVDGTEAESPWRPLTKKERASGKSYLLVDRRERGGPVRKWDRESATVKRSCDALFDDDVADLEDFIVPLWRGLADAKAARTLLCKELSSRCSSKLRTAIPDAGRDDFPYVEEVANLVETERMMQNMEDQGMPMVMQSRDDMLQELVEQLTAEGMSEDEAHDFIEATTAAQRNGEDPFGAGDAPAAPEPDVLGEGEILPDDFAEDYYDDEDLFPNAEL